MFRNVVEKSILHICTGFKEILPFHLKIFPLNLCYEIKNLLTVKNNVYEKEQTLFFSFFCLCCFLFCALDVQAQQDYWKGQVKDAVSGEPMIGVSVRVKGTGSGTITDFDGNFSVKASKGDILVISYVGYKTLELDLKNKTTLGVISLGEDTETLEEVVVVGYGVQKKVSSVGSIATAKGDDLLKVGSVNSVSEALQGQMPGVVAINSTSKPGADQASLLIRGKSTWGEAAPLVLVDGIERDFNDVDVNEIESISVLKDASATAVYGVKGANGVILLTTKRGLEQKPEISFTANFGFKQPSAAPEWADYVTSMKQYNRARANDGNWGQWFPNLPLPHGKMRMLPEITVLTMMLSRKWTGGKKW